MNEEKDIVVDLLENLDVLDDMGFGHINVERSKAAAEIDRLRNKCNHQAMILRRLNPEMFPDTLFIHSLVGEKDENKMPEKIMVVPAFGVDFSYIYERTGKTVGPEW